MAHYLTEQEFRDEVILCQKNNKVSDKLAGYFTKLATHLTSKFQYTDPMDREDVISGAVLGMLEKYQKFDSTQNTNCFSYFTQMTLNGSRAAWNNLAGHRKFTSSIDAVFEESI